MCVSFYSMLVRCASTDVASIQGAGLCNLGMQSHAACTCQSNITNQTETHLTRSRAPPCPVAPHHQRSPMPHSKASISGPTREAPSHTEGKHKLRCAALRCSDKCNSQWPCLHLASIDTVVPPGEASIQHVLRSPCPAPLQLPPPALPQTARAVVSLPPCPTAAATPPYGNCVNYHGHASRLSAFACSHQCPLSCTS